MVKELVSQVLWGDVKSERDYLYGSRIQFELGQIKFENSSFASGKAIKKWVSRTNYQADRQSPNLPLLLVGYTYEIEAQMITRPQHSVIIQLDYYNRQQEHIGFEVLREGTGTFTYPKEAYSYTITLVGAGCQSLTFESLSIFQVLDEAEVLKTTLLTQPSSSYTSAALPSELNLIRPLITVKEGH